MPTKPVRINIRCGHELWPPCNYPVAFLYVDEQIVDFFVVAWFERRVRWLPRWFPFNTRIDASAEAAERKLNLIRKYGETLAKGSV